jgi:hypothetical protein
MQSSVLGDDAVINAAAVAMAEVRDEQVFVLLRELGKWPSLTGGISAWGSFGRIESIRLLINAHERESAHGKKGTQEDRTGKPGQR